MTVSMGLPNVTAAKIQRRGAWWRVRLGGGPRWRYTVRAVRAELFLLRVRLYRMGEAWRG